MATETLPQEIPLDTNATRDLYDACRAVLETCEGHMNWNGKTREFLVAVENAVTKAEHHAFRADESDPNRERCIDCGRNIRFSCHFPLDQSLIEVHGHCEACGQIVTDEDERAKQDEHGNLFCGECIGRGWKVK